MTIQELDHYAYQLRQHTDITPPVDVTLERIRRALFGFFGIREDEQDSTDKLVGKAPSVTKEEFEAWEKAGMPSPPPWKRG